LSNILTPYNQIYNGLGKHLLKSSVVNSTWQSTAGNHKFKELENIFFKMLVPEREDDLSIMIKPDLPWAEDHFQERVCGKPLNPGKQYKNWPYYNKKLDDKRFRENGGKFSHTYMERYWNKDGNLYDVINKLQNNSGTRQAYLSVWIPEDSRSKERIPCSLGYWFKIRDGKISITYHIRSCDFIRHFKNDIYMTARLLQWARNLINRELEIGILSVWIGSLHCFESDVYHLKKIMEKIN